MKTVPILLAVILASSSACLGAGNNVLGELQSDAGASAAPIAAPVAAPVEQPKAITLDAAIPANARPFAKSEAGEDLYLVSKIGGWGSLFATSQDKSPRRWYVAFLLDDPPAPSNFVQLFEDPPTKDLPHPRAKLSWNEDSQFPKAYSQIWRFTKPESADNVGFWAMIQYPDMTFCQPMVWWGDNYKVEDAQKTCDASISARKASQAPEANP